MDGIKWVKNNMPKTECPELALMSIEEITKVRAFHESFSEYAVTPLVSLECLAEELGLGGIYVKDESFRFGLNAFKVLGGAYAIAKYIDGRDGEAVFYTATDGNHGRGVAWAARRLGHKAVIFMPDGSSERRREHILGEGAACEIKSGMNYDDCVRLAAKEAAKVKNGVVLQDTSWEGYKEIPAWIMQGYGTIALEADEQLRELGVTRPTHIFTQAGVGSFAGAITGVFKNLHPENCPVMTVVEPNAADCIYRSAVSGKREIVSGEMRTIMAGLANGEPNAISWEILKNCASFFASCPDMVAAKGMRMLAYPKGSDKEVVSGESGAVGLGLAASLMMDKDLEGFKDALGLDRNSRVLVISSEGDTDPEAYRAIVHGGAFAPNAP